MGNNGRKSDPISTKNELNLSFTDFDLPTKVEHEP
jgi:hypothetical protein